MLTTITLKLTSPFLGSSKPNKDGIREIIKNDNKPTIFIKRFTRLCQKYAAELNIPSYRIDAIKITNHLETNAKEKLYHRDYTDKYGCVKTAKFESYPTGSILTLDCYVNTQLITVDKAIKILSLIGKYDGISQFGLNTNFGRFDILLCTQNND